MKKMPLVPDWRPTATRESLVRRAELLEKMRRILAAKGYLEVDVPALGRYGLHHEGTRPICVQVGSQTSEPWFLQTSPESPLKRLLAAGYGPVFTFFRAFRDEVEDPTHNSEFTLLEWYVPGCGLAEILDQTVELLREVAGIGGLERLTFRESAEEVGIGAVSDEELRATLVERGFSMDFRRMDRRGLLDFMYGEVVVPAMKERAVAIVEFPEELSCLARVENGLAKRFEIIVDGIELANGCEELLDREEHLIRMRSAQASRDGDLPRNAYVDEYLLAAVSSGLPRCCGVGVGVDRVLMRAMKASALWEVVAFPTSRA